VTTQSLTIVCYAQGCTNVIGTVQADPRYGNLPAFGYLCQLHGRAEATNPNSVVLDPPPTIPAIPTV